MESSKQKKILLVATLFLLIILCACAVYLYNMEAKKAEFYKEYYGSSVEEDVSEEKDKKTEIYDEKTEEESKKENADELSDWDKVFKNREENDDIELYAFNPKSVNACFNYAKDHNDGDISYVIDYVALLGYYCGIGDSTAFMHVESNYEQYTNIENDNYEIMPYEDKIELKATVYDECSFDNEKVVEKYGHDNVYSSKTIEEDTTFQYQNYDLAHGQLRESKEFSDLPLAKDLTFKVTGLMILNGNNESEEMFNSCARAKTIKITIGDKTYTKVLEDTYAPQFIDIDYTQNASKPVEVRVEVIDSYPGENNNDVYISDIQLGMIFNGSHGI